MKETAAGVILAIVILSVIILGSICCVPDPRWCEHRIIPQDNLKDASNFIRETLRVSRPGREPVALWEAEETAVRMYGYCPQDCKDESYLQQARREIAAERAADTISNELTD